MINDLDRVRKVLNWVHNMGKGLELKIGIRIAVSEHFLYTELDLESRLHIVLEL